MPFGFSARPVQIATEAVHKLTDTINFASTRPVQIATVSPEMPERIFSFASTRSVQIATFCFVSCCWGESLCLHTLRADCNPHVYNQGVGGSPLPPHAPCRLQRVTTVLTTWTLSFASTRSVQIATRIKPFHRVGVELCLHTLRADCNRICAM